MKSLKEQLEKYQKEVEQPGPKIDRLYTSVKLKFRSTLNAINAQRELQDQPKRFFLYKEELDPILTEEEANEFIGFWKGSFKGRPIIKEDCITKRLNRMVYKHFPNLNKELRAAGRGKKFNPQTGKSE